ncbi:MAG: efflux RND transporter periplasmic adaptor subunit [Verrucomicrobiales bacterium]|nr:efflux RND transporter periplasmic adaptor subunit [Verrucomicrobiales bacterium]
MKHRLWIPCMAVAAGLVAAGCHEAPKSKAPADELPAVQVQVQAAATGVHRALDEVVGTVRARTRAAIEAKVSGRIARLLAAPGAAVEAGAVLAELDLQEMKARVEQARAVMQQADREMARIKTLLAQGAVTQAEFDAVESRQSVAKATVNEAETLMGYAKVTAPFSGVITRKLADEGSLAAPGRPIFEMEDPGSLRFEADIPVTLVEQIRMGDRLRVVMASVDQPVEGVVSEIEPSADPASRTFRVRLDLPAKSGARAGLFGRVGIPSGESTVLTVPTNAVVVRGQLEQVFAVNQERAQLRLVRTGKRLGAEVEILSGVDPGEKVVIEGAKGLVDGQKVVVKQP